MLRLGLPILLTIAVVLLLVFLSMAVIRPGGTPRRIDLEAHSYAFSPGRVEVRAGDTVTLALQASDVTHGLYVDGYAVSAVAEPGRPVSVTFVADRPGKFRLRCSVACGSLHPFMLGELVVLPQSFYPLAQGLTLLSTAILALALPAILSRTAARSGHPPLELERLPLVGRLLRSRLFPWVLHLLTLAGLLVVIVSGFLGTPVGSRSFAIVYVWIVWWGLLVFLLLPLGGRSWCAVCPLPLPGEWLARRGLLRVGRGRPRTLGWRWPRPLRNIWLQNVLFLGVATFSALVLTRPLLTAAALLAFLVVATITGLLFRGRVFCRYLCPVGGFIGLYALAAPLQLRVRDEQVCRQHREKQCLHGSEQGYGCPWGVYPGALRRNSECGLCTECLKTCSLGNVSLRLATPGQGFLAKARLDEAFKAFIMLSAAMLYAAVLLGRWGWLKDLAGRPFEPGFLVYAAVLWGGSLLVVPGLYLALAAVGRWLGALRQRVSLREYFTRSAYALVPLGLGAWLAFTLAFVPANISYALGALVDPLGQGWDLGGLRGMPWMPLLPSAVPYLQVGSLLLGLLGSLVVAAEVARRLGATPRRAALASIPVASFGLALVGGFLRFYLG